MKGYAGILCCIDSMSTEYGTEEGFMNLCRAERPDFYGRLERQIQNQLEGGKKGYLCGHHMKVRVQGSEKGTEIPAGDTGDGCRNGGFKPVVAQV